MLGRKGKGSQQQKSDKEALLDAFKEMQQQQERKERRQLLGKRFAWLRNAPGWVKTTLKIAVLAFLALIADGVRRESKEFHATLIAFNGQVMVTPKGGGNVSAQSNMKLSDKDVMTTGANGAATVVFPDGSAVQLEPNTQFEVRLLDFARGERRDRSFMVRFGSAVTHVSQFFGAKSEATVCTPTAVAAVRGTGFRVTYDPRSKQLFVQVVEGTVQVRTPLRETQSQFGQAVSSSGYQLQPPQRLEQRTQQLVANRVRQLTQYEVPPHFLQKLEWGLNTLLDPILQLLGLGPGSWGYNSTNFARRGACIEALRRLRIHLESTSGEDVPDTLNPITLEELQLDPRERGRLLDALAGNMLVSYRKLGKNNYVVRARARDKSRTLYELTNAEITKVRE
jgi:hypothetical protein